MIDVGPTDGGVARRAIASAIVKGGLAPLIGDGIDDALAGEDITPDAARLAAAMAEAQRAFGQLDCAATVASSTSAIGIAAARQAAGIAVPELTRAWTYVVLCAERANNTALARTAITRLRTLGGSAEVPADLWAKYPEVDALLDREMVPIEITTPDAPGAEVWIDHVRAGVSPLKTLLPAGEHVIAAAKGERRGFAMGSAVKTQTALAIPTPTMNGTYGAIAKKVASWGGVMPAASEIGAVLTLAKVRAAIVRRGDVIEAWGRAGRAGEPHLLGSEDGRGTIDEAPRLVALIADRIGVWNDRAPDPDQLLTEENTPLLREKAGERRDEPAKWWVYATLAGAILGGGALLYFTETAGTTQRVELHIPRGR
ncbi:MAG: hypothetical protein AB7T06_15125 [Kofleriaceae bacterium]